MSNSLSKSPVHVFLSRADETVGTTLTITVGLFKAYAALLANLK